MGIMAEIIAKRTNQNNNTNNIGSLRETEVFLYFSIINYNLFRGFKRNNNNNNLLSLLSDFEKGLEGGFNLLLKENLKGLDSNIITLINALIEINLRINYIKKKSNYIKPIKFRRIEIKDSNK